MVEGTQLSQAVLWSPVSSWPCRWLKGNRPIFLRFALGLVSLPSHMLSHSVTTTSSQ